jgi:hypothetical protein
MGAITTEITGTWDPRTGLLLSNPISLIDPFTGQIVPGVDVFLRSTSFAIASGFDPVTSEQITRAAAVFGDTATLTQILVLDANGNPMSGVTITSASGTVYPLAVPPAPSAVPEPATLPLIAVSFAMLVGQAVWPAQRRRRVCRA